MPPVRPMLAKPVKDIATTSRYGAMAFEPKWDRL